MVFKRTIRYASIAYCLTSSLVSSKTPKEMENINDSWVVVVEVTSKMESVEIAGQLFNKDIYY